MANHKFSPPSEKQVSKAIERYRDHLFGELNLKSSTIENYLGVLRRAAPVIGLRFTPQQASKYLSQMAQKGNKYAHLTVTAVGLERYLKSIGRPSRLGRPRKPKAKPIEPLSEVEIALMIRHAPTLREKAMLSVLAYSAIRNSEFSNLEIRDVNIARQTIYIRNGKGGKDREVNISGACVRTLADYLNERNGKPTDRLFVTKRNGNPYQTQDLRKFVRVAARRAGITRRVNPHLFRHSLAQNLVYRGADVFTVQQQLGHDRLATTMLYLHPSAVHAAARYHACVPQYAV